MSPPDPPVRLAADLDRRSIAQVYARVGRVHITPIVARDCAERVLRELQTEIPWQVHFNDGDRPVNLDGAGFAKLPEAERNRFIGGVYSSAAQRFQYLFDTFPAADIYGRGEQRSRYVMRVYEWLNSPEFLGFAREVTGSAAITFADASATRYQPGHFLAYHDDDVKQKDRIAAYVLNFSPQWKSDWGGILQFIDRDGHIAEGYTPVFNAMNLFRVPQPHAVSFIAPFARGARYSITGWLRSGPSPLK
jgi:SM-20-related protein